MVINKGYLVQKNSVKSCGTILSFSVHQFVKQTGTKQNFGLDGSSKDFTIGKCKVVHKYIISFVFIAKKGLVQVIQYKLRVTSVDIFLNTFC